MKKLKKKVTKPTVNPVKIDYTFLYWKTDNDTEFDFLNTNISEDITLTAYYVTQDTQTYTGTGTPNRNFLRPI